MLLLERLRPRLSLLRHCGLVERLAHRLEAWLRKPGRRPGLLALLHGRKRLLGALRKASALVLLLLLLPVLLLLLGP